MKGYHKSALLETLFILVFAILPTIFGGLKIFLSQEAIPNSSLYKSGEFFLYAISLLSSAYLVYNHFRIRKSDFNGIFSFLALILIILFSYAYTAMANTISPNLNRVMYSSIIAFLISIPIFFYAQVISNKNSPEPDVSAQRREEQQTIEDALN